MVNTIVDNIMYERTPGSVQRRLFDALRAVFGEVHFVDIQGDNVIALTGPLDEKAQK